MKTIKIIDLLNKIANEEEVPKKVRYNDEIYDTKSANNFSLMIYEAIGKMCNDDELQFFINDEVEIIEEKKIPEKLELYEETQNIIRENNYKLVYHDIHKCIVSLECKYNQLIDYLKSKGE